MDIGEIMNGLGSSQAMQDAAGKAGVEPGVAQNVIQTLLQHVADGGTLENVAEQVAGKAGVDPGIVQSLLPQVLPLLQGHAENASDGAQGVLGSLMGAMGGMMGGGDAQGGGGLLGMAKGLFGGKG